MFKIILTLFLILQVNNSMAEDLTLLVRGIEAHRGGNIIVFIFTCDDNPKKCEGYPKKHDKAVFFQTRKATAQEMKFQFSLDLDEIAVKILHDEDENGKVTKNRFGIYPAEGLGFSKGQRVRTFGPPKYKKSKVTRADYSTGLTIHMRYP